MSLNIGRKGRTYIVLEVGYGVLQDGNTGTNTLSAAAAAMRHIDFKFSYDPFNRRNSTEKKTSPGQVNVFDSRATASLNSLTGLLRPSGTLGTVPECDPVLQAAFGNASRKPALSTTVASGGGVSGCTLTSATGLAVNDPLLLITGGKKYVRFITAVNTGTGVTTWAPPLPTIVTAASAVKSGLGYALATDLATSLAVLHCLSGFRRECRGIGIDKFSMTLDANMEPQFTASGPAQKQLNDAAAVADPGTFTSVGGNPPSGIVGETYIGSNSYLIKKGSWDVTNGLKVRNSEQGAGSDSGVATEVYRDGRRAVGVTIDSFVETPATLHDYAVAGTQKSFFNQTGRTEGNIIAVYMPKVDWKVPDTDNPDGPASWAFKGAALESADGANDEVFLALM